MTAAGNRTCIGKKESNKNEEEEEEEGNHRNVVVMVVVVVRRFISPGLISGSLRYDRNSAKVETLRSYGLV